MRASPGLDAQAVLKASAAFSAHTDSSNSGEWRAENARANGPVHESSVSIHATASDPRRPSPDQRAIRPSMDIPL
uniref:Uncharacterized protein n=1 Tax=Oryza punctata TaxID=4537 RepID=A0A0E0LAW2_ORYPU